MFRHVLVLLGILFTVFALSEIKFRALIRSNTLTLFIFNEYCLLSVFVLRFCRIWDVTDSRPRGDSVEPEDQRRVFRRWHDL